VVARLRPKVSRGLAFGLSAAQYEWLAAASFSTPQPEPYPVHWEQDHATCPVAFPIASSIQLLSSRHINRLGGHYVTRLLPVVFRSHDSNAQFLPKAMPITRAPSNMVQAQQHHGNSMRADVGGSPVTIVNNN